MTHSFFSLPTALHQTDTHTSDHAARIARLTRWIAADWLADLRETFQPIVVYDPVYDYPVVRFTVAGELWTAHAYETRPRQRTWRVRTPMPELWRDGSAEQLAATITQLVREYRAVVDNATAYNDVEHADAARADALATGRAAMWTWPAGRELRIYRASWCIGVGGAGNALFDSAWTEQRSLSPDGRLELCEARPALYLMAGIHKPVFEEYALFGIGSLPNELAHPCYTPFGDLVGEEPVVWLQNLITQRQAH